MTPSLFVKTVAEMNASADPVAVLCLMQQQVFQGRPKEFQMKFTTHAAPLANTIAKIDHEGDLNFEIKDADGDIVVLCVPRDGDTPWIRSLDLHEISGTGLYKGAEITLTL
jgi:hypothetical protein